MIFQKKIDRAFQKLHEDKQKTEEKEKRPALSDEMEKGDLPAMIIAAMITILPVALLALLALAGIGYLFLFH